MTQQRRDSKNRILNNGEYQKKDGRYVYCYTDITGEIRFVYSWTLTRTDRVPKGKKQGKYLRELEKEIAKDLQDGISSYSIKDKTLNEIFEEYLNNRIELRNSTIVCYSRLYKVGIAPAIGKYKLTNISKNMFKAHFKNLIINNGYKISTILTLCRILTPIFNEAVDSNYIRVNPLKGISKEIKTFPINQSQKIKSLTKTEQQIFMNFVRNNNKYHYILPLFIFLLGTGCRIGQALGLTWNDCDFENDIIHITHILKYEYHKQYGKNIFYISPPRWYTLTK